MSNQCGQKKKGKCLREDSLNVTEIFVAALDGQDRLNRAYDIVLRAAHRAEEKKVARESGTSEQTNDSE